MAAWKGGPKKGKGPDGPEVFPAYFLKNHDGAINQIILQKNTLVTTSSDGKITIWDNAKRSVVHEFRGDSKRLVLRGNLLYCCSFGVFGNQPGVVSVYDIQRKGFVAVYKGHSLFITDMILSESTLFTASADHTIRLWDTWIGDGVPTGEVDPKTGIAMEEKKTKKVLYGHSGVVNCLIITDKNILISGSADTTIKIWTSQGGNIHTLTNTMSLVGHAGAVNALEWAAGSLYSASADDSIRVWNTQTGQCSLTIKLKAPIGLFRHDDSVFVQHTSEHAVTQISTKTGKVTRKYEGHTGRINVLKFSLHHMYTGSDDSTLRRWNLKRGTCSTVFKGHKDKVHSILLDLPMMFSGSTDTSCCGWEILRNEDETPEEVAEEEADWKRRKEADERELASVLLAQQNAPPTSPSVSRPATISRSNTGGIVPPTISSPTPAAATTTPTATSPPAASNGSGSDGIDWMSALSMTSSEKMPTKRPHKRAPAKDDGSAGSSKSDRSNKPSSNQSSPSGKRGGIFSGLVRTASELRMSDREKQERDRVSTPPPRMGVSTPVLLTTPPPLAAFSSSPASTFAERSETSDDGSESSGFRGEHSASRVPKAAPVPASNANIGMHKARPATPTLATPSSPAVPVARRTLPFSTWAEFMEMCGLEEYTEQYEALFRSNAIELDQVPDFNNDVLKELKIKMGHIMKMMKVVNSLKNP